MTVITPEVSKAKRLNGRLEDFWEETVRDMRRIKGGDRESWETRELPFPLSRVKRLMRVEETVSSCQSHGCCWYFSCHYFVVYTVVVWVSILSIIEFYCSSSCCLWCDLLRFLTVFVVTRTTETFRCCYLISAASVVGGCRNPISNLSVLKNPNAHSTHQRSQMME